jgi:hypothetical protein
MNLLAGVSILVGIIAGVAAVILLLVAPNQWPKINVALVLTASAGILNGSVGPPIHRFAGSIDRQISGKVGALFGTTVTGVVALALVGAVIALVYFGRVEWWTLTMVALVPPMVTIIPGVAGTALSFVAGVIPWGISYAVTYLFGGM